MKKIIIADDNRIVVESVARLIPWESHGFEIAATAFDGEQALEAIRERGADIVITDIKMPRMDGLELIRKIKEELLLDAKTVVLSSYNDFQLVRTAMRLGASEYILKTELEPEALLELMNELSAALDKERADSAPWEGREDDREEAASALPADLREELRQSRRHIRNQLLRELCLGYASEQQFMERKKDWLHIRYRPGGRHYMLYFAVDNFQKLLNLRWRKDEHLLAFAIMNVLEEIVSDSADLFDNGSGEFAMLASSEDESGAEEAVRVFERLAQALQRHFQVQVSAGFSELRAQDDTVPRMFIRAVQACQLRFMLGKGKLIHERELARNGYPGKRPETELGKEQVEHLRNVLNSFHPVLLREMMGSLPARPGETSRTDYLRVLRQYEKYTFVLAEFADKHGYQDLFAPMLESFNELIFERESIPELNRRLLELLEAMANAMATGNSLVRAVIRYVQLHYREEITLQSVAEHIGVSSAHLGRLIQKDQNMNFSEYVNQFRIERAKELLAEGRLRVFEIAEAVGYNSVEHFGRMFKRVAGMSPREFATGEGQHKKLQ